LLVISIMEWTENKTKLLIEEVEKHPCLYMFWQFIAYVIVQLLKQFYCARKLHHKLPQFIAVCVIALRLSSYSLLCVQESNQMSLNTTLIHYI